MRAPVQVRGVLAKVANLDCCVWSTGARRGASAGREGGWYHSDGRDRPARGDDAAATRQTDRVIAIIGGLGAAVLWATATLCSSRSSRMIGSRVVLGWVMVVGLVVGLPIAVVSPAPGDRSSRRRSACCAAGICYVVGLQSTYAALRIGKVSIVAPIVATEGAVAALIAVALGDPLGIAAGLMLAVIVVGVVLSTLEPGRADVPAGDFDLVADALDGPAG